MTIDFVYLADLNRNRSPSHKQETAGVSYFQARDKTWVSLAGRGARKFGTEEEQIEDEAELRKVRKQAREVIPKGFLVALPLTFLSYLRPL